MNNLAKNKISLEALFEQFNHKKYLSSDPAEFMHRYKNKQDQEIVAFIAACFAYGRAAQVRIAVEKILNPLGNRPALFLKNWDEKSLWPSFVYRFHREVHVVALLRVLKQILLEFGSLERFFQKGALQKGESPVLEKMLSWVAVELETRALVHTEEVLDRRGLRFLFSSPKEKSSCKRILMFLRWMVRQDAVDMGLWNWLEPKDLVIPTDTHIARLSHYLRLRKGKENTAPNWKMAQEITQNLKKLDLSDPVKFDFALTRLGILNLCKRKYVKEVCSSCAIESSCRFAHFE